MGAQLDGRSDLYALGIMSYELAVGALPFVCKTPGEMITAHLKTMPPPPSQVAPAQGIPPLLDQVILKLLAKKRDDRYRDTADLRGDLARLLRGETGQPAVAPRLPQPPPQQAPPVVVAPQQPARPAPPTDRVAQLEPGPRTSATAPASGRGRLFMVIGIAVAIGAIIALVVIFAAHK